MSLVVAGLTVVTLCGLSVFSGEIVQGMRAAERRRQRARRTPIVRAGEAQPGALVRVAGRVRPLNRPLRMPLSGIPGVYHSTEIVNAANFAPDAVQFSGVCSFIVEDESGGAVVLPRTRIDAVIDEEHAGAVERDDPEVLRLLGEQVDEWIGSIPLSWRQRRIETGQEVTVWGRAVLEAGTTATGATLLAGFREPPRRLVIAPVDGAVVVERKGARRA